MSDAPSSYLFRDPSLWLGRLQNILTAIEETIDQTDMQIAVREKVSHTTGMFEFQLIQIKSLKSMLEHMKAFGESTLVECAAAILKRPNALSRSEKFNPKLDLLRTAFHELTTDLNIVQRALNQRLWAAKYPPAQSASEEINNQLVEDLKQALKAQVLKNSDTSSKKLSNRPVQNDASGIWGFNAQKNISEALKGIADAAPFDKAIDTLFEHEAFKFVGSMLNSIFDVEVRSKQTQTLIYADILANYALLPAQNLVKHVEKSSTVEVVTYFTENNVSVRILPYYTDIILVGLPYSAGFLDDLKIGDDQLSTVAQLPWEFLSIPHEIGHYLFWNGIVDHNGGNETIDDYLRQKLINKGIDESDWRYHWLEELFADAFKCKLMGPVAILGFQVMLSDAAQKQNLLQNNGYHPIPALRPLIASRIVEAMSKRENTTSPFVPTLDTYWQKFLSEFDITITLDGPGKNEHEFEIVKDKKSKEKSAAVKGQWTNHMHRDQPGETVKWPEIPVKKTYSEVMKLLEDGGIVEEILDILNKLDFESMQVGQESILGQLTASNSGASLFPWPEEFNKDGGEVDVLVKRLADHLSNNLNGFSAPGAKEFSKSPPKSVDLLELLDGKQEPLYKDLVDALAKHYLANWGDKGPRGGNIGG